MLQLLHLDVSKVDRVLHTRCAWKAVGGADDVRDGVGDVRGSIGNAQVNVGPLLVHSLVSPTR